MHTLSLSNASLTGLDEGATGARRDSLEGLSAITRSVVFSQLVNLLPYFRDSRLRMCWGEGWERSVQWLRKAGVGGSSFDG